MRPTLSTSPSADPVVASGGSSEPPMQCRSTRWLVELDSWARGSAGGYRGERSGLWALAQHYHIQALDMAMRAGDRPYAAKVLATMSRMTVRMGENAPAGHDALRHGRQAVALARSSLSVAQSTVTPGLAAELHALEARGLAVRRQ